MQHYRKGLHSYPIRGLMYVLREAVEAKMHNIKIKPKQALKLNRDPFEAAMEVPWTFTWIFLLFCTNDGWAEISTGKFPQFPLLFFTNCYCPSFSFFAIFYFFMISHCGLRNYFDVFKATGLDKILNFVLKSCSAELAGLLSLFF